MSNSGSVALVTGANRGIGLEVVRQLAERGHRVLLSARNEQAAIVAATEVATDTGATVTPLTLDVSLPADIQRVAEQLIGDPGQLDVLVNNAGVGLDFGTPGVDPNFQKIQQTLETNFFGAYRLTVALLPLLRASDHPRIVNVSSGMGGVAEMGGWSPGYRVSKAALNAVTRILAAELADEKFKVNSACPGFVKTDMGGPMGAQKSVQDGAAGIVWLATLPDDGPTGGFFRDGSPVAF